MKQIPISHWPNKLDWPIAMINLEPADLTSRLGIEFAVTFDDLDYLSACILTFEDITFVLTRHRGNPVAGTIISIFLNAQNPRRILERILIALELKDTNVIWKHPAVAPEISST